MAAWTGKPKLEREREEGNVEYKLKVVSPSEDRIERLATQMRYRLKEGGGEAIYELGVSDDGELIGLNEQELNESLKWINEAAKKIGAKVTLLRKGRGRRGVVAELLVRLVREDFPIYVMVPVLGNVDSGKSTVISVLCTGELDDGNGSARSKVVRFLHELKTGRTSSISSHLLGFDETGNIVNYRVAAPLDESEIFLNSSKVICLVDLGGHERYLRTTLKGVTGRNPDYIMLCVAANAGMIGTAKEHLGIAVVLKIPVFIVITKTDIAPKQVLEKVLSEVQYILKRPGINKIPMIVNDIDDVVVAARNMAGGRIAPIFLVSNTTGEGLELLRKFLNILPPRLRWEEKINEPFKMYVEEKFNVKGVGTVVSGLVLQGEVEVDDYLQLGPFRDGSFRLVKVRSIHVNRVSVDKAIAGQEACLALRNVEFDEVEKGMCILDESLTPRAVKKFRAKVTILHHPTTIKRGYQAVLHIYTIRQAAKFTWMSKEPLRTGDVALVNLEFCYKPEYVISGDWFVFREGRTRGYGIIQEILD